MKSIKSMLTYTTVEPDADVAVTMSPMSPKQFAHDHIRFISIDGNIGSGKSTLLSALSRKYADAPYVIFLEEPLAEWNTIRDDCTSENASRKNILEYFYEDQSRYAFTFQIMAYISRLAIMRKTLRDIMEQDPHGKHTWTIICERSILTDRHIFASMLRDEGKMTAIEMQIYLKWFDEFIDDFNLCGIIYVNATDKICYNRIQSRGRSGELGIELEYLEACHAYHTRFIDIMQMSDKYTTVLELDGSQDINKDPQLIDDWMNIIESTFL